MAGIKGNAIAQGALGGNREAVAEGITAGQQQIAQAPVIAGLENQGYSTALNTALTEQQQKAGAAYSLGNLGVSGQNAALTGANAQIGAGTLQQQNQQQQDATAYQQYMNQLAYPYQQTQWLAGLDTGVGSNMGGTSQGTSTAPAPNQTAQYLGLGLTAAGMFMARGGGVSGVAPEATTVPETRETLHAQQRQLVKGHRRVQMFPHGTPELPLPPGMKRVDADGGAFHYDPKKIDPEEIRHLSARGRENEMLDLGPYSKHDVMQRLHGGEVPTAVVERQPDGTEVRAAAGTHSIVHHQLAAMHRTKSPGNTLHVEDPRHTLAHRIAGHRAYGGAVGHFDLGGAADGVASGMSGLGGEMGGTPYSAARGWIPSAQITRGRGAPPAQGPSPTPTASGSGPDLSGLTKALSNLPSTPSWGPTTQGGTEGGVVAENLNYDTPGGIGIGSAARGGRIPHGFAMGGGAGADTGTGVADQISQINSLAKQLGGVRGPDGVVPSAPAAQFTPPEVSGIYRRGGGVRGYAMGGVAGYDDGGGVPDYGTPYDGLFGSAYPDQDNVSDGTAGWPRGAARAERNPDEPKVYAEGVLPAWASPTGETAMLRPANRDWLSQTLANDAVNNIRDPGDVNEMDSAAPPATISGQGSGRTAAQQAGLERDISPVQRFKQWWNAPAPSGVAPSYADISGQGGGRTAADQAALPTGVAPAPAIPAWASNAGVNAPQNWPDQAIAADGVAARAAPPPLTGLRAIPSARATDIRTPTAGYADTIGKHLDVIAQMESGGEKNPYAARTPTKDGDFAYGKFQVKGENIPQWTKEILGHAMTPQQFLNDPDAQNIVARGKFGQYVNKYGPEGAAKAWFAGEHGMHNPNASDGNTTVAQYARNFAALSGGDPSIKAGLNAYASDTGEGDRIPAKAKYAVDQYHVPGTDTANGVAPPAAAAAATTPVRNDIGPALMTAGLSMMANRSPFLGVALGEAGLAGMGQYTGAQKLAHEQQVEDSKLRMEAQKIAQSDRPYSEMTVEQKEQNRIREKEAEGLNAWRSRGNFTPSNMMTEDGHPTEIDRYTGIYKDAVTQQPLPPDARLVPMARPGAVENLANHIIQDAQRRHETDPTVLIPTLAEATDRARKAPDNEAERLAINAARADPSKTLQQWRQFYGLPDKPTMVGGRPAGAAVPPPASSGTPQTPAGAKPATAPIKIPPGMSMADAIKQYPGQTVQLPDGRVKVLPAQ